jgi:outer membrane receptor protein involved in Fe transport
MLCPALADDSQPATADVAQQETASQEEEQVSEPSTEQSEAVIEIEVKGERERPAHVDVIRAEELREMPNVQNVGDAIQRLPGTQTLTGCVMNSPRPSLRGSSYTWLQVLVDGIPVNPIGACVLNRVSASGLGEIEVVRGPAAPKYPGNTVSGVLSMKLKSGDQFPGGQFSFTGGSFGTQVYDLQAGGGTPERNYFLAYNRNRYTGWMPKDHLTDLTDIAFKAVTSLGEDSQLTVVGTNLSGEKQGFRPSGPNPSDKWEHRWPNLSRPAASFTYTRRVSPRSDILLRLSPLSMSYDLQYQQWDKVNLREVPMQTKMRYFLLRGEFQHNCEISPENLLSWGLWWQRDRMRSTKAAAAPALGEWSSRALSWRGLFAQSTFLQGDRRATTIGMRYDDTEPGEAALSPFVSTHQRLGRDTGLRLAISRNKRFPVLDELYGVGVNTGNRDLKPHTAWNYEVDLERNLPGGRLTLALFRQDHTDMILLDPTYTYQNLGKARIQGAEIGYEGWLENGSWWANCSLLDADDLTKDRPLVLAYRTAPPRHMLKAGVTIHRPNGLTYTLEALGYGSRRTDVDQPTFVGEPWNVVVPTSVPAFVTVNCRVSKEVSEGRSLFVSVENLLDRDFEEILFYQKPGRWVNVGFTQSFD